LTRSYLIQFFLKKKIRKTYFFQKKKKKKKEKNLGAKGVVETTPNGGLGVAFGHPLGTKPPPWSQGGGRNHPQWWFGNGFGHPLGHQGVAETTLIFFFHFF
jgi:hypothetical protein